MKIHEPSSSVNSKILDIVTYILKSIKKKGVKCAGT